MADVFDVTVGAEMIGEEENSARSCWNHQLLPETVQNLKFSGEVEIAYSKTEGKDLVFKNCIFDTLSIKNERAEQLQEIRFVHCRINTVRFFRSDVTIVIESSQIQSFMLDYCNIPKFKTENSEIKNISFGSSSKTNEVLILNDSYVGKFTNIDAEINTLELHSSHMGSLHIDDAVQLLEIKEGAVLERFFIDNKEELKQFLKTLQSRQQALRGGTVSQKAVELKHQHQIMIAAHDQYADENRFQEMDMCLVRLRKINCRLNSLSTNNPVKKAGYLIESLVLGTMFGWGVQIINSLITSLAIIAAFALIHFCVLRDSIGNNLQCIQVSLMASVNRFFNANEIDPVPILGQFDTLEQIIGVIILTILTGVIARKIIR